jgi:DDE family transposase
MPRQKRVRSRQSAKVDERLVGAEHVKLLQDHLTQLRCGRDHPNRTLHDDTLLTALLLNFYESSDRSLRQIEDLSCSDQARDFLPDRTPRSTLSDALASMDPKRIEPIIEALWKQLPQLKRVDDDLAALLRRLIAADGSLFTVPADVAWALSITRSNGKEGRQVRLNLQLDVLHFVPAKLDLSGDGDGSESAAFVRSLLEEVIYLLDRNFVDFSFLHMVLEKKSDFVVRLKSDTNFVVIEERPLSQQDKDAGVLHDRVGNVPGSAGSPGFGERLLRELIVWDARNKKEVRLLTTLLDLPARTIGQLYRQRWSIELFFRWLKCVARFEHLISHNANGIAIQFYVAVIAVLLSYLRCGHRPGVYEFNCLAWVARGVMSLANMQEVLARRQRERDLAKARRTRQPATRQA